MNHPHPHAPPHQPHASAPVPLPPTPHAPHTASTVPVPANILAYKNILPQFDHDPPPPPHAVHTPFPAHAHPLQLDGSDPYAVLDTIHLAGDIT